MLTTAQCSVFLKFIGSMLDDSKTLLGVIFSNHVYKVISSLTMHRVTIEKLKIEHCF